MVMMFKYLPAVFILVFVVLINTGNAFQFSDRQYDEILRTNFSNGFSDRVKEVNIYGILNICALTSLDNKFNDSLSKLKKRLDFKNKSAVLNYFKQLEKKLYGIKISEWQSSNIHESSGSYYAIGCVRKDRIDTIYNGGSFSSSITSNGSNDTELLSDGLSVEEASLLKYHKPF